MIRYNVRILAPPQAASATEVPLRATQAARWPDPLSASRPSAPSVGVAILLHVTVLILSLTLTQAPEAPEGPGDQAVAMVFTPRQSVSSDPLAASASPDELVPAETPMPPVAAETPMPPVAAETPAQPSPAETAVPHEVPVPATAPPVPRPEPPPPPAAMQTQPSNTPPAARRRMAQNPLSQTNPVPTSRRAETPSAGQARPPDVLASRSTPAPAGGETPIPGAWQHLLATWLAAHKTYPDDARRNGTEGSVILRFTADRSGRVLDVVLVRSAGSSTLDAAAEAMVHNATLPPFTAGMSQDTVTVTIQLRYALTN